MSNSLKSRFKKAELKPENENINSETEPITVEEQPIIEEKTADNEIISKDKIVDSCLV